MINWPWLVPSIRFEDVKAEVGASFRDFRALTRLVALAYPNAPREHIRIGCELMNVFFLLEEYTDNENGAEFLHRFWARAIKTASLSSQRHFLETFTAYLHAVVVEALIVNKVICAVLMTTQAWRLTIGATPSFAICEMGMDLPDEAFYHPAIVELVECSTDMIIIGNDIVSYNKEQAAGSDGHNLISTIMLELGLDIGGAIAWAAHYHAELQKRFIDASVDVLVKEYLDGIAIWPRADTCWSYEGQRSYEFLIGINYHLTRSDLQVLWYKGPEIQQTRLVPLLSKAKCITA
ncbi:isoprenoid synthase domain-containing protein [Suillus spraguei]|nr:isoprenoid synthase domain-containing protein [Suillus spraguei]